jgi:ATP-dependent RNA helicase RhlE
LRCRRPYQESSITTSFESLGLRAELVRAVADQGYTQPTPVQAQAIPVILQRRDILAGAQTGTGKTAGFVLPLLQLLTEQPASGQRRIRVLILTPTRELAAQIEESVRTYGAHLKQRSATVFGGVSMNNQIRALRDGVDILVATPGRLLDHLQQRTVNLSQIEFLVLDEADRMLDMGFIRDIRRILAMLPDKRQNLFFSATFSSEIRGLADSFLHNPVEVAVARSTATADLISQVVHPVDKDSKRALLTKLIADGDWRQVLVFTRTKHGANRLAEQLDKDGITADAIHGNKSQNARTRALADFKEGKLRVLVATDIAARGLDIEQLPHVVNYELPNVPEDYVHRIGRTGRAGTSGQAISLVSLDEAAFMRDIERLMKVSVERVIVKGFEPSFTMGKFETAPPAPPQQRQQRPQQQRRSPRPASTSSGRSGTSGNGTSRGTPAGGRPAGGNRNAQTGSRDANRQGNRRPTAALLNGNR